MFSLCEEMISIPGLIYLAIGAILGVFLLRFFRVSFDAEFIIWSAVLWPIVALAAIIGFGVDWLNKKL